MMRSRTAWSGNLTFPSPCAHQTPSVVPSMPFSMTAGDSWIWTLDHLLSNLPDSLCTNLGWTASSRTPSVAGIHPRRAISWHPLQMPSEKVSVLL